jgi:hypothetical protein
LALEEAATMLEGGSFMHAESPAAKLAKDAARAIRGMKSAASAQAVPPAPSTVNWPLAGKLMEAHHAIRAAGNSTGTSNWGAALAKVATDHFAAQAVPPVAPTQPLVAFIEEVRRFNIQRVRVGALDGPVRWDIEYSHDDICVSAPTLQEALNAALKGNAS